MLQNSIIKKPTVMKHETTKDALHYTSRASWCNHEGEELYCCLANLLLSEVGEKPPQVRSVSAAGLQWHEANSLNRFQFPLKMTHKGRFLIPFSY